MKNRNSERLVVGMVIAVLVFAVAYEIWQKQFGVLAYFALVIISPILVLFISDRRKGRVAM